MFRLSSLFHLSGLVGGLIAFPLAIGCSSGGGGIGRGGGMGGWPTNLRSAGAVEVSSDPGASGHAGEVASLVADVDPWGRWEGTEDPAVTEAFVGLKAALPRWQVEPSVGPARLAPGDGRPASGSSALAASAFGEDRGELHGGILAPRIAFRSDSLSQDDAQGMVNPGQSPTMPSQGDWSQPQPVSTFVR